VLGVEREFLGNQILRVVYYYFCCYIKYSTDIPITFVEWVLMGCMSRGLERACTRRVVSVVERMACSTSAFEKAVTWTSPTRLQVRYLLTRETRS
jgi:hypothetical protein